MEYTVRCIPAQGGKPVDLRQGDLRRGHLSAESRSKHDIYNQLRQLKTKGIIFIHSNPLHSSSDKY